MRNQKGEMLLNLILKSNNELVSDLKVKGILGYRGYKVVEFRVMKGGVARQNRGKLCTVQGSDWKNPL